jgi:outer membrane protein assembly factor BamB
MRAAAFAVPLAIGVSALAGCGALEASNDRVNSAQPMWFHHKGGALEVVNRVPLTISSRTVGEDYERGQAAIDPVHRRVFMGTSDGGLYALRSTDLSVIWRFETAGAVQSQPLYDAELDVVYFGSHDGALYCVEAANGRLVWRFSSGAEVDKKPVVVGETLFFANGADNLFAIDRRSGKTKWNQHRTPALGMEISGYAGPAYDEGRVFMAYSDGHVMAYDARDGTEAWPQAMDLAGEAESAAGGETPRYLDVDTTPIVDELPSGRVIYVAGYAGGVYALGADSGAPVWKNEQATGVTDLFLWHEAAHTPNPRGPDRGLPMVPDRKYVIAASATSGLWALEAATGKKVWDIPIPDGGVTAPAALSGALLVGTTRYGLFLVSPIDGRVIDGIDLGTGFSQAPAAFGNRAFAITNSGTILGLAVNAPLQPAWLPER